MQCACVWLVAAHALECVQGGTATASLRNRLLVALGADLHSLLFTVGCTPAGAWAEMQFDTESGYTDPSGNATDQRAQVRVLCMTCHSLAGWLAVSSTDGGTQIKTCTGMASPAVSQTLPLLLLPIRCVPAGQPELPALLSGHGCR